MNSVKSLGFEALYWIGPEPKNEKRRALLADLALFLGFKPQFELLVPKENSKRTLCLVNIEDLSPDCLKVDSEGLFLGVLGNQIPASMDLLASFEQFRYTFYLDEGTEFNRIKDYLTDLFRV